MANNNVLWATFGIVAVILAGLFINAQQASTVPDDDTQSFEGHFAAVQPLQELNTGANELSVTQQDLPSNGTVYDTNVVSKFDVNGTNGETTKYALPLELDGSVGDVDLEITSLNTTAFDLRNAYVVKDEDDLTLTEEDATYTFSDSIDDNEVDTTIPQLADGEHALVVELKGITTGGVANDADLVDVTLDAAEEDADSDEADEVVATFDNAQ